MARIAAEDRNEQSNVDWTVALGLAARAGPRELIRARVTISARRVQAAARRVIIAATPLHLRERPMWTRYKSVLGRRSAEFATQAHNLHMVGL